jgi:hypothetical protein
MSQETKDATISLTAGEALVPYRRVKLDASGYAVYADSEPAIGITQAAAASGAQVAVRLLNGAGTFKMVASAAVTARVPVYGTADGKVDDTATEPKGHPVGVALEAATADGDVIEVLVLAAAQGIRQVSGQHTTVAASDTVVTGLAKVLGLVVQLDSDPVDGAMHATGSIGDQAGAPAAGSVLVNTWKSTDGDATLVAATTFSKLVNWLAWGY